MELCSIASGSSGNCIYTGSDHTHLMIDAGISGKRMEQGLNTIGLSFKELNGILITHEHSDHIAGLGVAARKYGLPIYATRGTINAILANGNIGKVDPALFHEVTADETFQIGDMQILPVHISHDAAEPVAYIIRHGKKSAAIVTDLGIYDEYLLTRLQGMDVLFLEANHDVRMLQAGRYPYPLKRRILGERGHLSNETSGKFLCELLHDQLKAVFLGHLSKENNYAKLAYETVRLEIAMGENPYQGNDFPLYVAKRDSVSECVCV